MKLQFGAAINKGGLHIIKQYTGVSNGLTYPQGLLRLLKMLEVTRGFASI